MFIQNQKVVCIDDAGLKQWVESGLYSAIPEQGKVYVVRGMSIGRTPPPARQEEFVVYLAGLQNPNSSTPPFPERGFNANRFKPLDELTEEEILQLTQSTGVEVVVKE